jgi:hypothetical protein
MRGWCVHLFQSTLQPDVHPRIRRAVYTPTQIINFAVVPPQFRFVFIGVVNLCLEYVFYVPLESNPTRNHDRHLFEYCQRTIGQRYYRGTRRLVDESRSRDRFCFVGPVHWSIGGYFHRSMFAQQRKKILNLMPGRLW